MNILSKEIWQLSNVHTAFFLSTAVFCRAMEKRRINIRASRRSFNVYFKGEL